MSAVITKSVAALAVCLFVAFPIASALLEPSIFLSVKALWLGLVALACVRPRWSPFVLVALVPLVPWLPVYSGHIPQGIVHLIVLSQALPLLVRYVAGRVTLPADRLIWGWGLFVAVAVASVLTHYLAFQAAFESWSTFWASARTDLARYVLDAPNIELENMIIATTTLADGWLTYLIIRSALDRAGLFSLMAVAACTAAGVTLFGFVQARTGLGLSPVWAMYDPGIVRINATFTDPNTLASYLALLIPLTLGLAGLAAGRRRLTWLAAVMAMTAALIMTAGRAGLLAACGGVSALLALVIACDLDRADPWRWVARHFRRMVYGIAALGVAALVGLVAAGTILDIRHHDQNTYLHTWLFTFNLRQPLDQIMKGRLSNWETAALIVQDRPVFGIGVGRIFRFFAFYNRSVGGAPEGARFSAHNTFLNVAAEMGAVGLLAWLLLLIGVFVVAIGAVRWAAAAGDRRLMWLLVGLLSGLAAYAFTMIPGDRLILREDVVTFAAVVAAIAGLRESVPAPASLPAAHDGLPSNGPGSDGPPSDRSSSDRSSRDGGLRDRWIRRAAGIAVVAVFATVPMRALGERGLIRLDRLTFGLHDVETLRDVRFRWTTGHATFHRLTSDPNLTLQVRSLAPFPQRVSIRLNGVEIDRLTLPDHAWRPLRYPLPPGVKRSSSPYYKIELDVDPVWHPPGDSRELGVMVMW